MDAEARTLDLLRRSPGIREELLEKARQGGLPGLKKLGVTGEDVVALQNELRRLGYQASDSGRFDWWTWYSWDELVRSLGGTTTTGQLDVTTLLWLPDPATRIGTCPLSLGHTASSGQPLVALPPSLLQAPYTQMRLDPALPESWVFQVSTVAPGLGQPGGALQVQVFSAKKQAVTMSELRELGVAHV